MSGLFTTRYITLYYCIYFVLVTLPRSFRLLQELEVGEKDAKSGGNYHTMVSFGVADEDDV